MLENIKGINKEERVSNILLAIRSSNWSDWFAVRPNSAVLR